MDFIASLQSNFLAVGQIFVLGGIGFYALRRRILGECCLRTVSNLVIDITLPCFMFTNILAHFHEVRSEAWYLWPLYCVALLGVAAVVARIFTLLNPGMKAKKEFVSLVTFQNSGFLPIILIGTMLPHEMAGRVYVYIFLFNLFFTPALYAVGERALAGGPTGHSVWRHIFNAPFVATALGLAFALVGAERWMPDVLVAPLKLVGDATIPLSMIVIGGIVMVHFRKREKFQSGWLLQVSAMKLVALPLIVFAILNLFVLQPEVRFLLLLEAMMPPAATLPLIAQKHNGDYERTGQALFAGTLMSLVTVPVLLSLLRALP